MNIQNKLTILADAAKYDASCASSGTDRRHSLGGRGIGSTEGSGICHSYAPDGRCISLLKILLTNFCVFDCAYCVNRVTSNVPRDRNLVKEYVSKANMLLANFVLRFDFANSLMNVVSTPLTMGTELASIRSLIRNDSVLAGKLAELTNVRVPGTEMAVPSNSKLLFNAVRNFWSADKEQLLTRYRANGDIKDTLS